MAELSPLRRRMIEDMTIRNLSPATQRSYISAVSKLSRHLGRSPDRLDVEDIRACQVHLAGTGISWPGLNQIVCALRFFYSVTLGRTDIPELIPSDCRAIPLQHVMSPSSSSPPRYHLRDTVIPAAIRIDPHEPIPASRLI